MKKAVLRILDSVNCRFENLDPHVRRRVVERLKFFIPYARHMPAFKLGRWDGTISFATVGGATFINLLDRVLPLIEDEGYEVELQDDRVTYAFKFPVITEGALAFKTWPVGHRYAGDPIMLRDYQVDAINTFFNNPQSIQEISTGSGKTIVTATLSLFCEPYGRTIVIVPNKSLVSQTEDDYRNLGLDVGVYFGDRKEIGHKHTIATWQSLAILSKKTKRDEAEFPIHEFIADVVCIMVDEVHAAKADQLKSLLTGPFAHIPLRWGLTGTIPKEEFEFISLLVGLGPVVGKITASELQDQGVLANCNVHVIQTKDESEFRSYHEEYKHLTTNTARLKWIGGLVAELSQAGNTVVLVNNIETGEVLRDLIPDSGFVQGSVTAKRRKAEFDKVQTGENRVLIATFGTSSTGINIPRIFNLVLVEPGKSFIRVIQSIGRGIRKDQDKDHVNIYDITSTLKFAARHLTKRKTFYKECKYPFAVNKIDARLESPQSVVQSMHKTS